MLKLLTPHYFMRFSKPLIKPTAILWAVSLLTGLYYAWFASPVDYLQGETVRIMYVHVPAAWMSLGIYLFMAVCGFSVLVWRTKLLYLLAVAAAPIGATFAFITLVTGSIWGKPIWGAWWVWDARLTSMLVLFLLYLCYIAVVNAGGDILRAEKPASVIALVGSINIPIVKFSVDIWYSLHQPASVIRLAGPAIHPSMLKPLLLMFLSFILYFCLILLLRGRGIIGRYSTGRNLIGVDSRN